jgi:hypothetical protein
VHHVRAYGKQSSEALNRLYSTDELIGDSWARGLDHTQIQDELAQIGRVVTLQYIAAQYARSEAEMVAYFKKRKLFA